MYNSETREVSNSLVHSFDKLVKGGKKHLFVTIRLNDEGRNGHQDFSVTGEIYEGGKPLTDENLLACGRIHDEIAEYFPEFEPFIKLHLADCEGAPMYAVENGFYHLKNDMTKEKFCNYYRIKPEQYDILKESKNELQFAFSLFELGIVKQWKEEAKEAIKILESLTNKTFLKDSKTHLSNWTPKLK